MNGECEWVKFYKTQRQKILVIPAIRAAAAVDGLQGSREAANRVRKSETKE